MNFLRELHNDAVNPNVDITTLLRKARILAGRLKNAEFEHWVKHEMNGYPVGVDTPESGVARRRSVRKKYWR